MDFDMGISVKGWIMCYLKNNDGILIGRFLFIVNGLNSEYLYEACNNLFWWVIGLQAIDLYGW